MFATARLGRIKNLAPTGPSFDPPTLQQGDVVSTKVLEFKLTYSTIDYLLRSL
jgi:hypothetical protein